MQEVEFSGVPLLRKPGYAAYRTKPQAPSGDQGDCFGVIGTPLCEAMKFYEKYPQLKEKGFLTKVLTDNVFSTMSLEDQQVSLPKVRKIVATLLKKQESKGDQFFANQSL